MLRRCLGALAGLALFLGLSSAAHAGNVYPLWKQELLKATSNTGLSSTTVNCQLATATYTYSAAHQFKSDLSGLISSAQTLGSKTFVNGKFTAAAITFTAVTVGSTATQVVCWVDTGTAGTSPLVVDLTGISVVTNGGDIVVTFDGTLGLFTL